MFFIVTNTLICDFKKSYKCACIICLQMNDSNTGQTILSQMDEEILTSLRGRYSGSALEGLTLQAKSHNMHDCPALNISTNISGMLASFYISSICQVPQIHKTNVLIIQTTLIYLLTPYCHTNEGVCAVCPVFDSITRWDPLIISIICLWYCGQ